MPYLLDANVFIKSKNLEYGFDFCPAFWTWLVEQHTHGLVFSIEHVGDELKAGNDDLAAWASDRGPDFFLAPGTSIGPALAQVSTWVTSQGYEPAAQSQFLQVADYFLVAQALADSAIVVTHEVPSGSKRRIKIPDVCLGLGVKYVTPYHMLRVERARFVLGPGGTP